MIAKWPWMNRGVFRHKHICITTRRVTMELPRRCKGTFEEAIEEFERNHTCDCPGQEFENEAQDDLNKILKGNIHEYC